MCNGYGRRSLFRDRPEVPKVASVEVVKEVEKPSVTLAKVVTVVTQGNSLGVVKDVLKVAGYL